METSTLHVHGIVFNSPESYQEVRDRLSSLGWVLTTNPDLSFYEDVMDTGLGPNQTLVFEKENQKIVVEVDHTLRQVFSIREGK